MDGWLKVSCQSYCRYGKLMMMMIESYLTIKVLVKLLYKLWLTTQATPQVLERQNKDTNRQCKAMQLDTISIPRWRHICHESDGVGGS